ncbi:hypothetical protein K0M31_004147 [Melipona bicolor]|uniref:Uncharacterized protein n=1 Tax=Melipona bicolor TaxID=60889 RepID=A0AA40KP61_9HYME|nr:hypothetical protein K0M31_004147 [Melipona bicolor]
MSETPPKSTSPAGKAGPVLAARARHVEVDFGTGSTSSSSLFETRRLGEMLAANLDHRRILDLLHGHPPDHLPGPAIRRSKKFRTTGRRGELNGSKVCGIREDHGAKERERDRYRWRRWFSATRFTRGNEQNTERGTRPRGLGYQVTAHGAPNYGSKSSSVTSFTRFPSEESLSHRRGSGSPQQHLGFDDRTPSEWYAEYRTQSFQNVATRIEYVRSKSEYDAHIAEIKGIFFCFLGEHFVVTSV